MTSAEKRYDSLDEWIAREAISFSLDSASEFDGVVDRVVAELGNEVQLLGLGEPTHGVETFLELRNRFFRRLVEKHAFSAIAIESSFPLGRVANEYLGGAETKEASQIGPAEVWERGFSHGFGRSGANRELIEWLKMQNANRSREEKLRFYGFDSPTEMTAADAPRKQLAVVLDYLGDLDQASADDRRGKMKPLWGEDAAWEDPAVAFEPAKGIGLSEAANALRVETEELISELEVRRPELIAKSDADRFEEAMRYATLARQMLTYHAGMARASENRVAELLGLRDVMMADNLAYIAERERGRGRVLVFAHNYHLKYGEAAWQFGPQRVAWWPAGAHVRSMLGPRYAVIGVGIGKSSAMGIGEPEVGSLEASLSAGEGGVRVIATHGGKQISQSAIDAIGSRTGTPQYFPFTRESLTDFDYLAVIDSIE